MYCSEEIQAERDKDLKQNYRSSTKYQTVSQERRNNFFGG